LNFKGGEIEFSGVKYSYQKDETNSEILLNDLSFKVEKGIHAAIVGPSGFGKSTLFNMIFRLLDPDQGSVSIDG